MKSKVIISSVILAATFLGSLYIADSASGCYTTVNCNTYVCTAGIGACKLIVGDVNATPGGASCYVTGVQSDGTGTQCAHLFGWNGVSCTLSGGSCGGNVPAPCP